jgi:hypothetical protein
MRFIKVSAWSKDGGIEFVDVLLPAKRVVCPQCDGTGKHVNPAIDGHGLSAEDFAEDPDFAESYFSGDYDVCCETCNGSNIIDEVDEYACKKRLSWWKGLLRHYNALKLERDAESERYHEMRVGA